MRRVPGKFFGVLSLRAEPALLPAVIGQEPGVFCYVICQTEEELSKAMLSRWIFECNTRGKLSLYLHLSLYIYRYISDRLSVIASKHLRLGKIFKLFS